MANEKTLDIILIRDGDNLIMQSNSSEIIIRLAYVDTNGAEASGEGRISSIIQGQTSEDETQSFLDLAKTQIENFVQSGGLDRERENIRLRTLLAETTAANAA